MTKKRIHLATETRSRSRCRYSSRPSRKVLGLPLESFLALPVEDRCSECHRKALQLREGHTVDVHHLEPGERVVCHECKRVNENREYGRGEAFLTGPDHPPFDGECYHHCKAHLSPEAVVPPLPDDEKKGHPEGHP